MSDKWAEYKEKFCGCKDASRLNSCKALPNCSLSADHPERKIAAPVVERQPVSMKPQYLTVPGLWIECKSNDARAITFYTAPPELAELQATIARLTAENERLKEAHEQVCTNYNKVSYASEERGKEIERLKAGQPAPVTVGHKLVPLTPTAAMVEAGINTRCGDDEHQDYRDVYAAMIGAAP